MKPTSAHQHKLLSAEPLLSVLFVLIFWLAIEHDPDSHELDLNDIETIDISLYSLQPPESLHLSNKAAELILYSNSRADTLTNQNVFGTLSIDDSQLSWETKNSIFTIDSLTITAGPDPTRVISDAHGYRYYSGSLFIKPKTNTASLSIVNTVDLESYVASVVGSEMDFEEPEALKAQAVVSRSYALWSVQRSPYQQFDLRDHEMNQVYIGEILNKPRYREAAESTSGEILTWSDNLILAVFSSTCGGSTANNTDVWGGIDHPYLRSQQDGDACSLSTHYNWTYSINKREFQDLVEEYYGFKYQQKVIEKDPSGRVKKVILIDSLDDKIDFTGNEFRLFINRYAGPLALRSTKYEWKQEGDIIIFEGRGLGHGVGLCQWGSRGLAQAGWHYKDILTFYFSGTKIVPLDSIQSNKIRLYN